MVIDKKTYDKRDNSKIGVRLEPSRAVKLPVNVENDKIIA